MACAWACFALKCMTFQGWVALSLWLSTYRRLRRPSFPFITSPVLIRLRAHASKGAFEFLRFKSLSAAAPSLTGTGWSAGGKYLHPSLSSAASSGGPRAYELSLHPSHQYGLGWLTLVVARMPSAQAIHSIQHHLLGVIWVQPRVYRVLHWGFVKQVLVVHADVGSILPDFNDSLPASVEGATRLRLFLQHHEVVNWVVLHFFKSLNIINLTKASQQYLRLELTHNLG